MKHLIHCLFFFFFQNLQAQTVIDTSYPDGIYYDLESFIAKTPDTTTTYKKLNLDVPTSKAFMDTIVDHVWFLDKNKDIMKKIFAVVHQGEIYFHQYGVKTNLMPEFGAKTSFLKDKLHRVQFRGRYLFGKSVITRTDPGAAAALGLMVGVATGVYIIPYGVDEFEAPFVFDTKTNKFFAIHSKNILQRFMDQYHPDMQYSVEKGRLDFQVITELFQELNARS